MDRSLAFACFVAGTVAFVRFFWLVPRLRRERTGGTLTGVEKWFPWLPGRFTAAGTRLRRQMYMLLVLGWMFLVAGLLAGGRT